MTISHPSFDCILPGGNAHNTRPRVALFISKCNPFIQVQTREDLVQDPDAQAFEVLTLSISSTLIYNIYNQKDMGGNHTLEWLFPSQMMMTLPHNCIFAGDFNAYHTWWNSRTQHPKHADALVTLMERNSFDLVNKEDTLMHFPTNGNQLSVLDLTFAGPLSYDNLRNWAVDGDASTTSDHVVIRFEIQALTHTMVPDPRSNRFNWKKADWELFQSILVEETAKLIDIWNLAIAYSHYY